MIIYILIFIGVLFLYFYNEKTNNPQSTTQLGIVISFLALFVGFSDMLGGYDRYIYGELFDEVADIRANNGDVLYSTLFLTYYSEFGYCVWNIIISFVTANRYIFIFITTLLIYLLLYEALKRYTTNYMVALLVFMGLMFFFTFTYLRQIIAAAIVWLSIKYILDRKLLKFLIIIIIAASFHNSAILFLPLYFFPFRKPDKRIIIPLMIVALIIGISGLPTNLFDIYGTAINETRGASFVETAETGFRFAYLFEAVFFITIILIGYDKIPNNNGATLMLNISLIFCAILLVFIQSENGGRLAWFFMIGIISTLTRLVSPQNTTLRNLILATSFALYLRIIISWGIFLYPYKTFFTNGVRENDKIEQHYEYDPEYEYDKFYR